MVHMHTHTHTLILHTNSHDNHMATEIVDSLVNCCRGSIQDHLDCVVSAVDSISYGDLVDLMVRRNQNWNLLPTQVDSAVFFKLFLKYVK